MEEWKCPPRKKKKKSSKKGTKNEPYVWSDNPKRVPQSVIHENLNTINRSIIEKWQRDNEARGRNDKRSYKARIHGH